jgi:hypothetical protein
MSAALVNGITATACSSLHSTQTAYAMLLMGMMVMLSSLIRQASQV